MLGRDEPGHTHVLVERLYAARPVPGQRIEVTHPGRERVVALTREYPLLIGGDLWCFTVEVVR